jgi:hypothetical protein
MKDEHKKIVTTSKGMGIVEVSKICAPKRFRRKSWEAGCFVYWKDTGDGEDFILEMYDESNEVYSLISDDISATDWEIVS